MISTANTVLTSRKRRVRLGSIRFRKNFHLEFGHSNNMASACTKTIPLNLMQNSSMYSKTTNPLFLADDTISITTVISILLYCGMNLQRRIGWTLRQVIKKSQLCVVSEKVPSKQALNTVGTTELERMLPATTLSEPEWSIETLHIKPIRHPPMSSHHNSTEYLPRFKRQTILLIFKNWHSA